MKRYPTYHLAMAAIAAMTVALFSCKDDEDPVIPVVSFQAATRTVGEDAGTIDVVLQLDVDAPREIKVRYTLSGTASEGTTTSSDFQVLGTYGEVTIPEGASTGTLQLQIKDDGAVEVDETVIITINDVVNDAATIGATPATTVTIQSNDLGAKVSFTTTTRTVNEDVGLIDVALSLDNPAGQELTVDYSFNSAGQGMAWDTVYAYSKGYPDRYYDFLVEGGTYGKATIPAGATTANITLRIYSDFVFENDEKIEMTLTAVSTGGQLGTNTKHTITVEQQDGRAIALVWDGTDVDMDLMLWVGDNLDELIPIDIVAIPAVTPTSEITFIPKVFSDAVSDAVFGLSFVYYSGTKSPLPFQVRHVDFADGVVEDEEDWDVYDASYTTANINKWDEEGSDPPQIEQDFNLVAGVFTAISSPINVPTSGSRRAIPALPNGLKKSAYKPSFVHRQLR